MFQFLEPVSPLDRFVDALVVAETGTADRAEQEMIFEELSDEKKIATTRGLAWVTLIFSTLTAPEVETATALVRDGLPPRDATARFFPSILIH